MIDKESESNTKVECEDLNGIVVDTTASNPKVPFRSRFLRSRFGLLALLVVLTTAIWVGYRYAPFNFVGSNPEIENLINQLASSNRPPSSSEDQNFFSSHEFLENPGDWDPTAQKAVSDAYYKLKAMGKKAFPYLIKNFDDDRYSHHRTYSTYVLITVGEACKNLIGEQVDLRGMMYKTRESPTGHVPGYDFDNYVREYYGSYAAWWRANQNQSLREMRLTIAEWRIEREKQYGFVSEAQRKGTLDDLADVVAEAKNEPETLDPTPPEDYTVDGLVFEFWLREQFKKKQR